MPTTKFTTPERYQYHNGFLAYHESEAVPGSLPLGANSPQKPPYGLYAEKFSGTAFTAPRQENLQSWLYRILPASAHSPFKPYTSTRSAEDEAQDHIVHQLPNQLRWDPFDVDESVEWVRARNVVARAGEIALKTGISISIYTAGRDMDENTAFYSADGDFLIVPQHGVMDIQSEMGRLLVRPNEICVMPRGVRYRVTLPEGPIRGYILELHEAGHLELPELGPIGSNGLANARDFQAPRAAFEEATTGTTAAPWNVIAKFNDRLFVAQQNHTPFDVVAWHGRYYPYKYDLGRFNTIGSISFDHPDPSIFTVLTAPSSRPGTAVADFVIFPPRWLVQEDTFRPPWYHRNTMSEFMGLIHGDYDAKIGGGFKPAGASLHNIMSAHGPDRETFEAATDARLGPQMVGQGSMAFMFESCYMVGVTGWGLETCRKVQENYNADSWESLRPRFKAPSGSL
ncbi:hypothetical protein LTS17_010391 [Exophiala oligosperma]